MKGNVRGAAKELGKDPFLSDPERAVLLELLLQRRLLWRASSIWNKADGEEDAAIVSVIDGGEAGLWVTHRVDGWGGKVICLTPSDADQVWDKLGGLVPYPAPADLLAV
jgi:hypothetical protein